jgi:hypothetical protein
MPLSPAFKGCSRAYFDTHLSAATCLDGSPHDGSPCLINDPGREAEASRLLVEVPASGPGVVVDQSGRPVLEEPRAS